MNRMIRKAPLGLMCFSQCNGGGGDDDVTSFSKPLHAVSLNCEEELDGYTEDPEPWSSKHDSDTTDMVSEDLQKETRRLLTNYYRSYTGFKPNTTKHFAEPTLNRVVEQLLTKHSIAYTGMVKRLMKQVDGVEGVDIVLEQVFSDGVTNWGRVASVLALGAVVCGHLKLESARGEESVEAVATSISFYLSTQQRRWFIMNNGWTGFVDFFRLHDTESVVRSALMAVAGVAGLGACLIGLIR